MHSLSYVRSINLYYKEYTVNGERFTGINFCDFQEHRESFPVNIHFIHIMALFSVVNVRHSESFPVKNYIGWNPRKFSPENLSPFTVLRFSCMLPSFLAHAGLRVKKSVVYSFINGELYGEC